MALFSRTRRKASANPNDVLVASGTKVQRPQSETIRRLVQPWQARSFSYYDQLPEIKYAGQFYSRLLSPLKLFAAEVDEDGDLVESEDTDAIGALDRIQDPGGGRTGLLGSYGRLMFLAGECYLFVSLDPDTGLEQWEMLSTDELRIQSGLMIRYKAPSLLAEEFHESDAEETEEGSWVPVEDDTAVAYRLWQRHPRWSMLADSTMMGVLDLCEELLLLTRAVRARARSRLAGSGMLFMDEKISPPPDEPVPDEDMVEDPFMADLVEAMTAGLSDEGAASSIVPLLTRVPVPDGAKVADLVHHLQIIDPTQLYPETGLRMECVKRIAIGLDMPPEELLGMADANHWTAWIVDEQTWKAHGQPKAQQLCDDLTSAYFRPYLRDVVKKADWMRYAIAYDATAIINHPDRTKDAKDLYDKRAIGKRALRETAGFDEEDAPTEAELAEMIGVAVHDPSLAWYGEPSVKTGGVETAPGEIVTGQTSTGEAQGATTGAEVEKGPPAAGPPSSNEGGAANEAVESSTVGGLVFKVMGASDMALLRAREAAGARLRSLAKRDKDMSDLINGAKSMDVAHVLGRENVRSLRISERDLVCSGRPLIMDALRMYGVHDAQISEVIADTIEQHAARTLYDRSAPSLPASFSAYVAELLKV